MPALRLRRRKVPERNVNLEGVTGDSSRVRRICFRYPVGHHMRLVPAGWSGRDDIVNRPVRWRALSTEEVRLQLSVLAYNLGNLWRRLVLPARVDT